MERFNIHEPDAALKEPSINKVIEQVLQIVPKLTPIKAEEKAKDKMKGVMGKIVSFFGRGKEIKILKKAKLTYRPYWIAKGEYFCEYLKKETYIFPVHKEVEEVYIKDFDRTMRITKDKVKLEDALEGVSFSAAGPSVSLKSLLDLGSALKGEVTRKFDLSVIERRERRVVDKVCINAISGKKEEDILKIIEEYEPRERKIKSGEQIKDGEVFPCRIRKAEAIMKLKKYVERHPKEAERILKRSFGVEFIKLVYVPEYHLTLESEKERKKAVVCGVSGKTNFSK
jgi:hypothetical protein